MFINSTTQKQVWEVKTWKGLLIYEHFLLSEDGTETNLLDNCEPWKRKELKCLRV